MTTVEPSAGTPPSPSRDWRLSILHGRADEVRAEVVLRATRDPLEVRNGAVRLEGTIVGPVRGRETTLPTTVRLAALPQSEADVAAARAVFTEPAYWTPQLPNLYRLEARVEETAGGHCRVIGFIDRWVGLRRFGVRGRSFWLDGRRWVVRGVGLGGRVSDPKHFGDVQAAVVPDPSERVCTTCDRDGMAVMARLEDGDGLPLDDSAVVDRLARWALHPCVLLVVVPRSRPAIGLRSLLETARRAKGTMLVGVEADGREPPGPELGQLAGMFDFLVVDLPFPSAPNDAWRSWIPQTPVVGQWRRPTETDGDVTDVAVLRRDCDRLQATIAAWRLGGEEAVLPWDCSGYLRLEHPVFSRS